jgi:hypothetical protein
MLDSEMIEDTPKNVNEGIKDKVQDNLLVNNRAGGNAPYFVRYPRDLPSTGNAGQQPHGQREKNL